MKLKSFLKFNRAIFLTWISISSLCFLGCSDKEVVEKEPMRPEHRFFLAIDRGDLGEIKELLEGGLPINVKDSLGNSGLMRAVEEEEIKIVRFFLERGANVNHRNTAGETALFRAVYRGNLELVQLLVNKGAETKIKTISGVSVFELAEERGEDAIIDYLKSHQTRMK